MKAYRISPIFRVSYLADAISFYTSKLGFTEEFIYGEPAYYAGVRKDNVLIHLNSADGQDSALGQHFGFFFSHDEWFSFSVLWPANKSCRIKESLLLTAILLN